MRSVTEHLHTVNLNEPALPLLHHVSLLAYCSQKKSSGKTP